VAPLTRATINCETRRNGLVKGGKNTMQRHSEAGLDFNHAHRPRSTFYDSPFGRMFGKLDPWAPPGATDAAKEQTKEQTLKDFATNNLGENTADEVLDEQAISAAKSSLVS